MRVKTDIPNMFAPEGASRCRALASGLLDRSAGRKEALSDERAALNTRDGAKSRKLAEKTHLSSLQQPPHLAKVPGSETKSAMKRTRRRVLATLAGAGV